MKRLLMLIVVGSLTGLGGCQRIKTNKIDAPLLLAEASKLMRRAQKQDSRSDQPQTPTQVVGIYELPKSQWPEAMAVLNPKVVRYSYRGVWILDFKWVSKESGLFIPAQEEHYQIELPEVAPGIFKYHSE
jgi:hypothetical protein